MGLQPDASIDPEDYAEFNAGLELYNQARFSEALEKLAPYPAFKAMCLESLGHYEQAYEIFQSLSGILASQGVARLSRLYDEPEKGIAAIESLGKIPVDNPELDPRWELILCYDMAGRYREAWDLAHELNKGPQVLAEWEKVTHRHWDDRGSSTESPIFIIGMPRSGTTLLTKMLVQCGLENLGEYDRMVRFAGMIENYPENLGNLDVMAKLYLEGTKGRTIDKTPLNIFRAGLIKAIFPHSIIIRIVRVWRDVALSCFFRNFHEYGWARSLPSIKDCIEGEQKVTDFWKQYFPIYEVDYEDLVEDPETVIQDVCSYAGLTFEEKCLSPHEDRTWVEGETVGVRKSIAPQIGKWRNYEAFDPGYWQTDLPR